MKAVRASGLLVALACCGGLCAQDGAAPAYRTDAINPGAAWYQPRPLEFPPRDSAHAIAGTLVAADFIHRSGTGFAACAGYRARLSRLSAAGHPDRRRRSTH